MQRLGRFGRLLCVGSLGAASAAAVRAAATMAARGVDYEKLGGRGYGSIKSWGREAGQFALRDEVPSTSSDGFEVATVAGGCFWGIELRLQRLDGVVATCVGYTQGRTREPTYDDVCGGGTGHTEAVQLIYDPEVLAYSTICETLLASLDPTAVDRVGNDYGSQYRHGIYYHSDKQRGVAEAAIADAQARAGRRKVVTEVRPATVFWPAEQHHQQYLQRGGRFGSPQSAAKGCSDRVRCYG